MYVRLASRGGGGFRRIRNVNFPRYPQGPRGQQIRVYSTKVPTMNPDGSFAEPHQMQPEVIDLSSLTKPQLMELTPQQLEQIRVQRQQEAVREVVHDVAQNVSENSNLYMDKMTDLAIEQEEGELMRQYAEIERVPEIMIPEEHRASIREEAQRRVREQALRKKPQKSVSIHVDQSPPESSPSAPKEGLAGVVDQSTQMADMYQQMQGIAKQREAFYRAQVEANHMDGLIQDPGYEQQLQEKIKADLIKAAAKQQEQQKQQEQPKQEQSGGGGGGDKRERERDRDRDRDDRDRDGGGGGDQPPPKGKGWGKKFAVALGIAMASEVIGAAIQEELEGDDGQKVADLKDVGVDAAQGNFKTGLVKVGIETQRRKYMKQAKEKVLQNLDDETRAESLAKMKPEDKQRIVGQMTGKQRRELLESMPKEERDKLIGGVVKEKGGISWWGPLQNYVYGEKDLPGLYDSMDPKGKETYLSRNLNPEACGQLFDQSAKKHQLYHAGGMSPEYQQQVKDVADHFDRVSSGVVGGLGFTAKGRPTFSPIDAVASVVAKEAVEPMKPYIKQALKHPTVRQGLDGAYAQGRQVRDKVVESLPKIEIDEQEMHKRNLGMDM